MHKLDAKGMLNLQIGDSVSKMENGYEKGFTYIGKLPRHGNDHLMFSSNSNVTTILCVFVPNENVPIQEWYAGEYDPKVAGQALIEQLEKEIKTVKKIYLK